MDSHTAPALVGADRLDRVATVLRLIADRLEGACRQRRDHGLRDSLIDARTSLEGAIGDLRALLVESSFIRRLHELGFLYAGCANRTYTAYRHLPGLTIGAPSIEGLIAQAEAHFAAERGRGAIELIESPHWVEGVEVPAPATAWEAEASTDRCPGCGVARVSCECAEVARGVERILLGGVTRG